MKRVLVTGAAGFVGANLTRRLVDAGHVVSILVREKTDDWRIRDVAGAVRSFSGDLRDASTATEIVRDSDPNWIFHLAAHGGSSWQTDAAAITASNVAGTRNLLRAAEAHGVERFLHAGSSSEYGLQDHPCREEDEIAPASDYAVAKAEATRLCSASALAKDGCAATLRLYSAYGYFEHPSRLIPTLIVKGLDGTLPPLVGPAIARDFVHIEDVVEAFMLAAEQASLDETVFNVCSGVMLTVADVVAVARSVLSIEEAPSWGSMPDRDWDTRSWVGDGTRSREMLGWAARTSFEQGFRGMVEWLRKDAALLHRYRTMQGISA
jgi:nucleoside-diphosphate-sugar epimerase